MDYERIEKPSPQGGGFSPAKLRAMLRGVEKRRKEEEEVESKFSLRSEAGVLEIDERRGSVSDDCKDVSMVSSHPECSTSMPMASGLPRSRDHHASWIPSRVRSQEEDSFDPESVPSAFEFYKAERAAHRSSALVPPFSKPAPSKWDDAQKWIANPNSSLPKRASGALPKKMEKPGFGSRQPAAEVVVEVSAEAETKMIDPSQANRGFGGEKPANWVPDPYLAEDSCAKPALLLAEKPVADSAINLSCHDSSTSVQSATTFIAPPSTVRSVSMRDTGTEMTPVASQEPSRTGTPIRATTPDRSPTSSRPSTPHRAPPSSNISGSSNSLVDCNDKELTEMELQMKTRREILILGKQLGKTNIAAWASKEEEEKDASLSLKIVPVDRSAKSIVETCAAAWEEAEKTKYLARFKREEIKIQAWENHQKAKTEAEMRKIEVEVERMRSQAHDKLMNKLAALNYKAEEKRAAAEAKRNRQAARTTEQVEYIRRTGRIPSSFSCWRWCS